MKISQRKEMSSYDDEKLIPNIRELHFESIQVPVRELIKVKQNFFFYARLFIRQHCTLHMHIACQHEVRINYPNILKI